MRCVFVVLTAVAMLAAATDLKCGSVITDPMGDISYEFDLSSLHHDESLYIDDLWYRTEDGFIYYVNLCGRSSSPCASDDTSVCVRHPVGDGFKYEGGGKTNTQKISIAEAEGQSPNTSITVTFSDGYNCGSGQYKTKIYINCNPSVKYSYFYNVEQPNECEAILYMWSPAGCGNVQSTSDAGNKVGLVVGAVLVCVVVVVAIIVGGYCIYKRKNTKASTVESEPLVSSEVTV